MFGGRAIKLRLMRPAIYLISDLGNVLMIMYALLIVGTNSLPTFEFKYFCLCSSDQKASVNRKPRMASSDLGQGPKYVI